MWKQAILKTVFNLSKKGLRMFIDYDDVLINSSCSSQSEGFK